MNDGNHIVATAEDLDESSGNTFSYAGFWRRLGAFGVDSLIWFPVIGLFLWAGNTSRMFNVYNLIPSLLISLWFHVYLVKRYGGTPGKLMLKVRIVCLDGSAAGYREALIRYSVIFVLSALGSVGLCIATLNMPDPEYLSLGFLDRTVKLVAMAPAWYAPLDIVLNIWIWGEFIVMLTNKRRRSIHDFMAGTVVVRTA